jgi:hypothetical protein
LYISHTNNNIANNDNINNARSFSRSDNNAQFSFYILDM